MGDDDAVENSDPGGDPILPFIPVFLTGSTQDIIRFNEVCFFIADF